MIAWLSGASAAIFLPLFIAGWTALLYWSIDGIRKHNKAETAIALSVLLYTLFAFIWRCKFNITSSRYHFSCGIFLLNACGAWTLLIRQKQKVLKVTVFALMAFLLASALFRSFWQFRKNKDFTQLGLFLTAEMKRYERPVIIGLNGEAYRFKHYTGLDAFTTTHSDVMQKELAFLLQESDCVFVLSTPNKLQQTCSLFPPERIPQKIGYDRDTNTVICRSENPQWRKKAVLSSEITPLLKKNESIVFAEDFESPVTVVCQDHLAFRVLKSRGLIAGEKNLFVKTMEPHGGFGLVNMKDAHFEVSAEKENVIAGKYSLLVHLPYCSGGMLLKQSFSSQKSYCGELCFKGKAGSRFTLGYWPTQQPIKHVAIEQNGENYRLRWQQPAGAVSIPQYQLYIYFYPDTVILDNILIEQR